MIPPFPHSKHPATLAARDATHIQGQELHDSNSSTSASSLFIEYKYIPPSEQTHPSSSTSSSKVSPSSQLIDPRVINKSSTWSPSRTSSSSSSQPPPSRSPSATQTPSSPISQQSTRVSKPSRTLSTTTTVVSLQPRRSLIKLSFSTSITNA